MITTLTSFIITHFIFTHYSITHLFLLFSCIMTFSFF